MRGAKKRMGLERANREKRKKGWGSHRRRPQSVLKCLRVSLVSLTTREGALLSSTRSKPKILAENLIYDLTMKSNNSLMNPYVNIKN